MKTGGRLVKHARYYWLLLGEGHLNRRLICEMLRRTCSLPPAKRLAARLTSPELECHGRSVAMCLENRPRRSEKVYYHGDNGSFGCVDWIHGSSEAGTSCSHGGSRLVCWEPRSKLEIPV